MIGRNLTLIALSLSMMLGSASPSKTSSSSGCSGRRVIVTIPLDPGGMIERLDEGVRRSRSNVVVSRFTDKSTFEEVATALNVHRDATRAAW